MEDCIFCRIVNKEAGSWKVMETEDVYAFFDINPVSAYHTLVIPKDHYENIFDIPDHTLKSVISLVKKVANLYREKLGIRNVQIISNSGSEAQQEVFHIHFHIVPRKRGDGQNIRWRSYPELRSEFDRLLEKIDG